jgi:deazaflavin-dependent oxidoreductase (nitroreductase family)
LVYA